MPGGGPEGRRTNAQRVARSAPMGAHDALTELGYRPEFVAVNHWPVAIDTYRRNHAGARAHCVTLDAAFPSHLVPRAALTC